MKVKPTSRWTHNFKLRDIGKIPYPNDEPIEVNDEVGNWLTRYGLANTVAQQETKSTTQSSRKQPPEWVEKSIKYINNKENDLSELVSVIGQENVDYLLSSREQSEIKNQTIKKLDNTSLKNLEKHFT